MDYLYNGIELPALPNWDKAAYPYAVVNKGVKGLYNLYCSSVSFTAYEDDYGNINVSHENSTMLHYQCMTAEYAYGASDGWVEKSTLSNDVGGVFWTNADIFFADGTLYLSASDPVPVTIPKWAHMNSFLKGLALGLAGKPLALAKQPVAYLYNGVRLPKLPEWDRVAYPYAVITGWRTAYVISEPFVVTDSAPFDKATPKVPFLRSTRKSDEYSGKEYWSEWEEVAESETILLYSGLWANHEILYTDETVCTPKGNNPIPVYLPEILFDGEVTVEANDVGICKVDILFANYYAVGDTLKVTINGVTEEYTVIKGYFGGQEIIGNEELINSGLTGVVDTGGAWGIVNLGRTDTGAYDVRLYTRNPGTYQLKIERIALGQE